MGDLCLVHAPWRELNAVDAEKLKKVPDGLTPSVPRLKIKERKGAKHESFVCWFGLFYWVRWNIMNSVFGLWIVSCWFFFSRCSIDTLESSIRCILDNFVWKGFTIHKFVQHRRSKSFRTFSPLGTPHLSVQLQTCEKGYTQIPSKFSPACFPFQHRKVPGDILNLKEKQELAKKVRKNSVPRAWGMLQLFRVDCTNRLLWSPWVKSLVMAAVSPGVCFQRRILQIPSRIVRFYPKLVDFCWEYRNILIWTTIGRPGKLFGVR